MALKRATGDKFSEKGEMTDMPVAREREAEDKIDVIIEEIYLVLLRHTFIWHEKEEKGNRERDFRLFIPFLDIMSTVYRFL